MVDGEIFVTADALLDRIQGNGNLDSLAVTWYYAYIEPISIFRDA